ncbi:hypothetical protein F4778DRAFT_722011 [Xylariomycetidae sp. FL2044]|nr:hypothetical protein F4778DRAFT_722011 [Xylariomycetidae sp. FL2044]
MNWSYLHVSFSSLLSSFSTLHRWAICRSYGVDAPGNFYRRFGAAVERVSNVRLLVERSFTCTGPAVVWANMYTRHFSCKW